MNEYMLMFSLGPVQSFIAQARKTRDLWLGSFLLSYLMQAGMEGIEGNFIFPAIRKIKDNTPDLPNKYIAIFKTAESAEQAADRSKKQIVAEWNDIRQDVWREIIQSNKKLTSEDKAVAAQIWKRQSEPEDFFEMYWVVAERKPNESYKDWLERTQAGLDARKRLRNFTPKEEPGEKSTVSGEREVLHGPETRHTAIMAFWKYLAVGRSAHDINKEGEERLDAIDTIKRFAHTSTALKQLGVGFPSTSSIATASFVERLLKEGMSLPSLQKWIEASGMLERISADTIPYLTKLVDNESKREVVMRDGDCYFAETFTAYRLHKDYGEGEKRAEEIANKGQAALRQLLNATATLGIARPTPYYAMIQMDGDKMGTLLSGVENEIEHTEISKALSGFSRTDVPQIVQNEYPGRLIYAGGDDVFALAPLVRDYKDTPGELITVLDLVHRLRETYVERVRDAVIDKDRQDKVSASTGIAIAHHFTALSYVRRTSKAAEDRAKKHYDRNALVVTILRRSGEQTQVGCRWWYDELKDEAQPIRLFNQFFTLIKEDKLSPKCVYILLEEAPALVQLGKEAQQSEIKRVLLRQRIKDDEKLFSKEDTQILARHLAELAAAMDMDVSPTIEKDKEKSSELHAETRRYGLVEVLGWLLVMNFLARKGEE